MRTFRSDSSSGIGACAYAAPSVTHFVQVGIFCVYVYAKVLFCAHIILLNCTVTQQNATSTRTCCVLKCASRQLHLLFTDGNRKLRRERMLYVCVWTLSGAAPDAVSSSQSLMSLMDMCTRHAAPNDTRVSLKSINFTSGRSSSALTVAVRACVARAKNYMGTIESMIHNFNPNRECSQPP